MISSPPFEVRLRDVTNNIQFADVFTDYFITFHFFKELKSGLLTVATGQRPEIRRLGFDSPQRTKIF